MRSTTLASVENLSANLMFLVISQLHHLALGWGANTNQAPR